MGNKGDKGYFICGGALIFIGSFLIIAGLVFQLAIFPAIVKHAVKKDMVLGLKDGELNDFANDWINSNYTVLMQYYIWNYTNAIEIVDRGMKPDAYEVGPYSYKQFNQYIYDNNSWLNDSNYFEYIENTTYYFDPYTSCEGCDPDKDYVRVPDIIFFVIMDLASSYNLLSKNSSFGRFLPLLSVPFFGYHIDPIITVKVSDLLFNGYKSPLVNGLDQIVNILFNVLQGLDIPPEIKIIPMLLDSISIHLNNNNATIENTYWYTINTGKSDYNDIGKVVAMRKDRSLDPQPTMPLEWWNGTDCDYKDYAIEFRGTNGDYFQPFIKKTDKLSAYVEDIYRSIDFKYLKESNVKGVDTYQFTLDVDSFNYSFPENCGYCQPEAHDLFGMSASNTNQCLPTGILDLTGGESIGGIPVHLVVSLPHFFGADDAVLKWFPRMSPDPDQHLTTLDIEPTTGAVLRANKRLQINVAGGAYPHTIFKYVPSGAFPIAWLNNSYLADDKTIHDVKHDLINPRRIVRLVCYIGGVGFGAILLVTGILVITLRIAHEKSKSPTDLISDINSRNPPAESTFRSHSESNSGSLTRRRPQNWE